VLKRVAYEVAKALHNAVRIESASQVALAPYLDGSRWMSGPKLVRDSATQLTHVTFDGQRWDAAAELAAREVHQVIHEAGHALDRFADGRDRLALRRAERRGMRQSMPGERDSRERVAQVMAQDADEAVAQRVAPIRIAMDGVLNRTV
jgi:hypothetical protein